MALSFAAWQPYLLMVVFAGLGLMGAGFLWRDRRAHLLRAAGWTLFAFYWPFQAPEFFWPTKTSEPDPINGWFTLLGPIFLLWIAWHEIKSYRWNEDPEALRWFTGAAVVSAATYFIIYEFPAVQRELIYYTTVQSVWMLRALFGVDAVTVGPDAEGASHIYLNGGTEYAVTVILACTAIQSIMIFVGAIACLKADSARKWKAYAITVPTIYVLNLFRNAGIVYGYKILNWDPLGTGSFEWMHSWVGKIGSLVAMVVIALAVFSTLPELHSNI
ncbi:MAG TPA: archaeosortase A, partial [Candidatus Thermoplasmatota archaeon]|nr:archaeosortase A [Candidatus Thermoplasmatota archaeon]